MKRAVLCLLAATACQQNPKTDSTSPAASAASASAAVTASASAAPAPSKPWFEGAWRGTFHAELQRIELPAGSPKEWKKDDGKLASGDGTLTIQVAPDGTVSGSAGGALGELVVAGRVEGDRAALSLTSADVAGFHGTILATQAADGMQGTLNASSGDSLQVRSARVAFTRAAQ